jgi:PAS domain S-box-containing protein
MNWDESPSARKGPLEQSERVFDCLFERSAEAIWLYDPLTGRMLDCNQAAVELIGADNKEQLLQTTPEELSPPVQPDGSRSAEKAAEIIAIVERKKTHCFEWVIRRLDGRDVPVEVSSTAVVMKGKSVHILISRDISERKRAEQELRELTHALERRVAERTAELSASEARFRALVEHAPEAIVMYSADTGRFLFGNQHACDLYGVPMSKLAELTPMDVSPEFQPCGQRTADLAREKTEEVLSGGISVFEWMHQQPNGRLIPTEVRLLRLPAEGRNLVRASIIDNTERKRAERALRESEEKFRALFEGSSQGIVLHDEHQLLEANPAAVRILGAAGPEDLVGKHPRELAPATQPNGESSDVMAGKYIQQCLATGSARFEWLARTAAGQNIPLEVALTRIEWSGRQLIQAFITDIADRQRAQAALAESEARFSAAFHASPILIVIARMSDERFILANDAFLNWVGHSEGQILGRTSAEFSIWERQEERESFWTDLRRERSIRGRECAFRNRAGNSFTMLLSSAVIQLNHVPHVLCLGLDITARKQAEAELRESEARLRETEARFSAAFSASPIFTGILRMSDGAYVLVNDAFVNWLGYSREEVVTHTSAELGMWGSVEERESALKAMREVGFIRQREVRWLNRKREPFTMLLSAETITLNNTPHILSFAQDITKRKRAEVEMLKALAREKELGQLKSNFVSLVSHEFRTPLGIIQSSAELLRDLHDRMPPAERQEHLESIARSTRRMAAMMEGVLVLSRLEAGKLDFQPVPLDLNIFFRRLVDEVLSATNRRCTIALSIDSVPQQAAVDERLLGHVFTNLLSNAVKYSDPGATVHLAVNRAGGDALCIVRDRGIGISEEDQQQLFKAFHRGSNVGSRPGTGMGLLLVKRCAELHGGKVQVISAVGEGTTVTVRLPVFGGNE